jgi:hypothetical protein
MRYSFTVHRTQDYLHVKVSGINCPDTVLGYMAEVRDACVRESCSRVLIEENLEGPSLSTAAVYGVVSRGSQNAAALVMKIAFVDVNPNHDPGLMKFAETVAVNRGVEVRVFKNVTAAEQWLKSETSEPADRSDKP